MLNTTQRSIGHVLADRRKQLKIRLAASGALTVFYGGLVGWKWILLITVLYGAVQAFEIAAFSGRKPWFHLTTQRQKYGALTVLVASSVLLGAPTLLLTAKLGAWGNVFGAYLITGSLLNTMLNTIGSRVAFRAAATPLFTYAAVMPFNSLGRPDPPTLMIIATLIATCVFLVFNVNELWRRWSLGKYAEIKAVRRYIAARNRNERRLLRLTQRDALTGMPNRDVLQSSLAQHAAKGAGALLMIDLDGFKYVNDTLGHSAGDIVLREIALRIQNATTDPEVAARLGGDEFAVLLPGVADPKIAQDFAEMLIGVVSQPVLLDGQPINIGASVGIVLHPLHGDDAEQLYANADLALYQAKAEGRHCARLYDPVLRSQAHGKVLRDTELGQALENGEFEMFYQPQFRLADGALTGAEALLRWRHPARGLLLPAEFLKALEGGLLSARVGAWGIETACRQAAIWRAQGAVDFKIAVNLFGAQFRSGNLAGWVTQACATAGLPPCALEIEITENVILRHEDAIIEPLRELRALGVGVAFDDYGIGFASLSMLTRFPVSRLKIDRSFTNAIAPGAPEIAIIHAIIALARALDMQVTAEGVETQAQAEFLTREGCDEAQGYFLGRPMDAAAFAAKFHLAALAAV